MIKKITYIIIYCKNYKNFFLFFFISLYLIGCTIPPRKPCIRKGYTYGIPDDPAPFYDWDSCYRSGLSYSQGECWDQAVEQFHMAIKHKSNDMWMARRYGMHFIDYFPHRELGIVYLNQGRIQKAIDELKLSLKMAESSKAKYYLNKARLKWLEEMKLDQMPPKILLPDQNQPYKDMRFTNQDSYIIKGLATDDFFVSQILVNEKHLFIDLAEPRIEFKDPVNLQPGENHFLCKAIDLIGHESTQEMTIILDQQGPVIIFSLPANISPLQSARSSRREKPGTISISGIIFDQSGVNTLYIAGEKVPLISGERIQGFQKSISPDADLSFYATDIAGNLTAGDLQSQLDRGYKPAFLTSGPGLPYKESTSDPSLPQKGITSDLNLHHKSFTSGPGLPHKGIKICYKGSLPPLSASQDDLNDTDEFDIFDIYIEEPPPIVYEPSVIITGYIESFVEISNAWINDHSIFSEIGITSLKDIIKKISYEIKKMVTLEGMLFYFARKVPLIEGENYITIRAEGENGQSRLRTFKVVYKKREIEKIGNRWRLAIMPFKRQRIKSPPFADNPPVSLDSLYYSLHNSFYNTMRFNLMERDQLEAIMRELALSDSNIVDESKGTRIGKELHAEVVLLGYIQEVWDGKDRCLEIQARLVDVETTEVLGMNNIYNRFLTKKDVRYLVNGLAQQFIEDFPLLKGTIIDKHRFTFKMDLCVKDLIKKGMKVLAYRFEEEDRKGSEESLNDDAGSGDAGSDGTGSDGAGIDNDGWNLSGSDAAIHKGEDVKHNQGKKRIISGAEIKDAGFKNANVLNKKESIEEKQNMQKNNIEHILGTGSVKEVADEYSLASPEIDGLLKRIKTGDFVITK